MNKNENALITIQFLITTNIERKEGALRSSEDRLQWISDSLASKQSKLKYIRKLNQALQLSKHQPKPIKKTHSALYRNEMHKRQN